MLEFSKRTWPDFVDSYSGRSLLRISHHPDRDNSPHYDAFHTDPRLGEITASDTTEAIIAKFNTHLLPILESCLAAA